MNLTAFDTTDYIRKANEKEHGRETSKTVTPAATAKADDASSGAASTGAKDDDASGSEQHAPRSQRRLLRRLGEAEGLAKAYKEIIAAGLAPAPKPGDTAKPGDAAARTEDSKPERTAYKTDAEFNEAIAAWSGRQGAKAELGKTQELETLRSELMAAGTKAAEDLKDLPDWGAVQKEAAEEGPEWNPSEHTQLMLLIGKSDQQARVLYHFAKNPEELEKMLALTKSDPQAQIRLFHRLEGRVEGLYPKAASSSTAKTDDASDRKPAVKTAAERDALKHKPSDSVAARGGSAAQGTVSPFLEDGKTVNPAWLARRNERDGRR